MHIKEIVVDGFKSYAHRTVIAGFDPHFNAITGLNGSGKSNILDSICFVLGITNLSQVRAGNLHELVYKQGQAGVNKAVVTIHFDNSDPTCSPVGYESSTEVSVTRQVLIGGKSKYLINGHTAQAGQVQNLFHSVQLNVNNPHFLIMQGRITKVLNMKPKEILGMVEEAAGTRMYETKKAAAMKTIEKKQLKVNELNKVLNEEITPTLEKLRGEKQHYLKWSKNNSDIERIERFCIAYEFTKAQKTLATSKTEVQDMKLKVTEYDEKAKDFKAEAQEKDEEIAEMKERLAGEVGEEHKELKANEEMLSKEVVKANSALQNAAKTADNAEADIVKGQAAVGEAKKAVENKKEDIVMDEKNSGLVRSEAEAAEKEYARLQEQYQNMCAGISSSEGDEAKSLPSQISGALSDANNAEAKIKQSKMKVDHLSKTANKFKADMKKEEKAAKALNEKRDKMEAKATAIQKQIDALNFDEDFETELYEKKASLENQYSNLREDIENLTAQLAGRLSFNFSDPHKGFDRSKVMGLVARLVNVSEAKHATALEVVAGGKLYQVVVDEAATGKQLLAKGKLQRRVTIIPLDKIQGRAVPEERSNAASGIAQKMGTTARPAIELVGFDEEVRTAVEYVFGSSLVVDGMEAANKICDATKTRTVTLQGDVYDPSGTISGGSNKNLGSTLKRLTDLSAAKESLKSVESEIRKVRKEWEGLKSASKKFGELSDKLELANAEFEQAEKHLGQTKYGMIESKYKDVMAEVAEAENTMKDMEVEKAAKWALHKELKGKEAELTKAREEKLKDIDRAVGEAKKAAAKKAEQAMKVGNSAETLKLELEALEKDVEAALEAVEGFKKASEKAVDEKMELGIKVGEKQQSYDEAKAKLGLVEAKMDEIGKAISVLNAAKNSLNKKAEDADIEAKKLQLKVKSFNQEKGAAERFVNSILKKHSWIESEKEHFGVEGGDYDFKAQDPEATSEHLKALRSEQASLSKKINKKVMGMIEKAEGEYTELLRKRKVIENDKKKIENVILELDEKKKKELARTWTKVNRDFGSIFSTLLPGTTAKLEPPEGQECWEGLEVKVAFGDVWKESLTELSGGQRSLLALSLILSMLLFKPAPMYILDEVDAALDLSHTQNIGNMLRTHFSQSQFIVVSLKEGMFNNANTIFRTKFVDGVSTVTRTVGIGASQGAIDKIAKENEAREGNGVVGGKAGGKAKKQKTASAAGKKKGGVEA
ncbi:hypothetical protein TrVE_jg8321 [Triparma verrucosa]|uniref:Structural maintenance of chromosomes protein n=1 Tax=Triparma verrucosa TaxID=1606542 RepID=A0A9W7F5M2_9STRA|nr:hypothetical protein TrVE_jg8321 [Triparma verrucosa]